MSPARGFIVILFGLALEGWLVRLVLSVSVILLALFLAVGRMLWTTVTATGTTTVIAPNWANIVEAVSLIGFVVAGCVVLGIKALRRHTGA